MTQELLAGGLTLRYVQSRVEDPVLWESHCHGQYELICVLQGDITLQLEGVRHRLQGGQTVLIPPLVYHGVTANRRGAYRRVTAAFDGESLPPPLRDALLTRRVPTVFPCPQGEALQQLCGADAAFYAPLAHSLLVQACYGALQAPAAPAGTQNDFVQRITAYVNAHLGEKITLDDLAAHTARSPSSVCHLFQQQMHISPKQYILQKKLAAAAQYLAAGLPPTQAALRVGYDNYSSFYRAWCRRYGTAPAARRG